MKIFIVSHYSRLRLKVSRLAINLNQKSPFLANMLLPISHAIDGSIRWILREWVGQPPVYECGDCHQKFWIPQGDWEWVKCPNPTCGREWRLQELGESKPGGE